MLPGHSLTAIVCLQGTNRPPRVNVLVDDNNLGPVRTTELHLLYCQHVRPSTWYCMLTDSLA